eukprot:15459571-Alexandrium_andersonii.AAC.1
MTTPTVSTRVSFAGAGARSGAAPWGGLLLHYARARRRCFRGVSSPARDARVPRPASRRRSTGRL